MERRKADGVPRFLEAVGAWGEATLATAVRLPPRSWEGQGGAGSDSSDDGESPKARAKQSHGIIEVYVIVKRPTLADEVGLEVRALILSTM